MNKEAVIVVPVGDTRTDKEIEDARLAPSVWFCLSLVFVFIWAFYIKNHPPIKKFRLACGLLFICLVINFPLAFYIVSLIK